MQLEHFYAKIQQCLGIPNTQLYMYVGLFFKIIHTCQYEIYPHHDCQLYSGNRLNSTLTDMQL